jgi:hypothetical protein
MGSKTTGASCWRNHGRRAAGLVPALMAITKQALLVIAVALDVTVIATV